MCILFPIKTKLLADCVVENLKALLDKCSFYGFKFETAHNLRIYFSALQLVLVKENIQITITLKVIINRLAGRGIIQRVRT